MFVVVAQVGQIFESMKSVTLPAKRERVPTKLYVAGPSGPHSRALRRGEDPEEVPARACAEDYVTDEEEADEVAQLRRVFCMANLVFNRPAAEWEAEGHDKELVDGLDHGAVLSRACLYQGTLMIDMKVPTLGNFECCITEETVLGYLDAGILPEVSLCCNSYLTIVLLCRVM